MRHKAKFYRYALCWLISVQMFFLSSCAGANDWAYSDLPKDYEIWRINTNEVALVKRISDTGADKVVPSYVSRIAWDENFILAQQQSDSDSTSQTISFYIVDVNSEDIYGPFSESEFNECAKQLPITIDESDWIVTSNLGP